MALTSNLAGQSPLGSKAICVVDRIAGKKPGDLIAIFVNIDGNNFKAIFQAFVSQTV